MQGVMPKLALDPKGLAEYKRNPVFFSDCQTSFENLDPILAPAFHDSAKPYTYILGKH